MSDALYLSPRISMLRIPLHMAKRKILKKLRVIKWFQCQCHFKPENPSESLILWNAVLSTWKRGSWLDHFLSSRQAQTQNVSKRLRVYLLWDLELSAKHVQSQGWGPIAKIIVLKISRFGRHWRQSTINPAVYRSSPVGRKEKSGRHSIEQDPIHAESGEQRWSYLTGSHRNLPAARLQSYHRQSHQCVPSQLCVTHDSPNSANLRYTTLQAYRCWLEE